MTLFTMPSPSSSVASSECNLKQSYLIGPFDIGHNNNKAIVHIEFDVFTKEMTSIIRNYYVIVLERKRDDVPVLPTRLADIWAINGNYTFVLGYSDQCGTETLVDEYPVGQRPYSFCSELVFQSGPIFNSAHRMTASMPSIGKVG
jgi:hypothetical protein